MALKPTIYKFSVALSDLDREHYDSLELTVAQHPSETIQRMMARLLAYCLNAQERLTFAKGLSEPEQPDIWAKSLDNRTSLWIDVGEPAVDRIKKASRVAESVKVYSFNSKSDTWWLQCQAGMSKLPVKVFRFEWDSIKTLALLLERTMVMSITVSNESAFVACRLGECEVAWATLQ